MFFEVPLYAKILQDCFLTHISINSGEGFTITNNLPSFFIFLELIPSIVVDTLFCLSHWVLITQGNSWNMVDTQ